VLSGKYLPGQPLPEGSRATDDKGGARMIQRWMRDDVLAAVQELRPVAEETGLTMPQLAVAWVLQNPNVASAIVVPPGRNRWPTAPLPPACALNRTS
jgi:aryl-alcohol dehydrogenase-like predicted oxidoreductase